MKFVLKRKATTYDIPLASIRTEEITAKDLMQIVDFTGSIKSNNLPATKYVNSKVKYIASGNSLNYKLISSNSFGEVLLTDQVYYDPKTRERYPLWYIHPLRYTYYNTSLVKKSVRKRVYSESIDSDRIADSLLPVSGNYTIPLGSVTVKIKTSQGAVPAIIDRKYYRVDYSRGTVYINRDLAATLYEYIVEYNLVLLDMTITSYSLSRIRVELIPLWEDSEFYSVSLLSSDQTPIDVMYLSCISDGRTVEYSESTSASKLYTCVPDSVRTGIINNTRLTEEAKRVFSLVEDTENYGITFIYVNSENEDNEFMFKSGVNRNTRVSIDYPVGKGFESQWYPRLTPGKFTITEGAITRNFTVGANTKSEVRNITEKAKIISSELISVSNSNIMASLGEDGKWKGIKVTTRNQGYVGVKWIDNLGGLIGLDSGISFSDEVYVTYSVADKCPDLDIISFNPILGNKIQPKFRKIEREANVDVSINAGTITSQATIDAHIAAGDIKIATIDNRKYDIVILMIDDTTANGGNNIFIFPLSKYVGGRSSSVTLQSLNDKINSTIIGSGNVRILQPECVRARLTIPGLPLTLINSLTRLEPIAIVSVTNCLDEDAYVIEDARLYGGGNTSKGYSHYDYSFYDGEGVDMSSKLNIEIPGSIYDDLVARARIWDTEVAKSEYPDQLAEDTVMSFIKKTVSKYSYLGTEQEIIIRRP